MAAVSAIDEAKQFLFRHPWATTDVDNPVVLLEQVVKQIDDEYQLIDEPMGEDAPDEDELDVIGHRASVERLLAFVQGLRDDLKISESEYQLALQLARLRDDSKISEPEQPALQLVR